jgi:hypothetical protein
MFTCACFKQSLTRRNGFKLAFSALWTRCIRAGDATDASHEVPDMTHSIPPRAPQALTGSQFAESVSNMDRQDRERAILSQILEGNLPGFLRRLIPVRLKHDLPSGKTVLGTVFVLPEYLAVGSDNDFLRIPMNLHTAVAVAERFRFLLPTRKIVDAVYDQSTSRFTPQPMPAGPQMTSTPYYSAHNAMIEKQAKAKGFSLGALVSGHKKDVVITNLLARRPGQIAIYGWHRAPGAPIQPLSTVHGAGYADYSHGIRLVGPMALIEGRLRSVYEILQDSVLAMVLSDEGAIRVSSVFAPA